MQVRYNRSVLTCENRFALMLPDVDDLAHAEMKRGPHKRASQKDFASSLKPRDTEVAGGRVDLRPKSARSHGSGRSRCSGGGKAIDGIKVSAYHGRRGASGSLPARDGVGGGGGMLSRREWWWPAWR